MIGGLSFIPFFVCVCVNREFVLKEPWQLLAQGTFRNFDRQFALSLMRVQIEGSLGILHYNALLQVE